MSTEQSLIKDIEAAASDLGMSPGTIGKLSGQGGHFYRRLKDGCRVWPETAKKVRQWIEDERSKVNGG